MRPVTSLPTATPSYRLCATFIARSVEKPSLRTASCCSVDVVNGAAGERSLRFFSTSTTRAWPRPCDSRNARISASRSALPTANWSSFSPPKCVSLAVKPTRSFSASKWIDQYSWVLNFSISASRSQMRRSAGLCTRPAESPRRIFFHSSGERLKPTR
jgi:hypothetical protein